MEWDLHSQPYCILDVLVPYFLDHLHWIPLTLVESLGVKQVSATPETVMNKKAICWNTAILWFPE